jgi:hypothetical protein
MFSEICSLCCSVAEEMRLGVRLSAMSWGMGGLALPPLVAVVQEDS